MVSKLLACITSPVAAYLDITFSEPCRCIYEHNKSANGGQTKKCTEGFSFVRHLMRQREMVSPNTNQEIVCVSVRHRYLANTGFVSHVVQESETIH